MEKISQYEALDFEFFTIILIHWWENFIQKTHFEDHNLL